MQSPGDKPYEITLRFRVWGRTDIEAEAKVRSHFPRHQWPGDSIKRVESLRDGVPAEAPPQIL